MKPTTIPMTNAIRALNAAKVKYDARCYDFTEHGGTIQAATELGLDHHATTCPRSTSTQGTAAYLSR